MAELTVRGSQLHAVQRLAVHTARKTPHLVVSTLTKHSSQAGVAVDFISGHTNEAADAAVHAAGLQQHVRAVPAKHERKTWSRVSERAHSHPATQC